MSSLRHYLTIGRSLGLTNPSDGQPKTKQRSFKKIFLLLFLTDIN